jgi:hypothetical protein
VVGEEDLLVLEDRAGQPATVDDLRLDPGALALAKAGLRAARLAGSIEELRPPLLVLSHEIGLGPSQVSHARQAPPPPRGRHPGANHGTRNRTKKELVATVHEPEPYTREAALESPR